MRVHAFRMQLKPNNIAEYRRRHDAIWPELATLLHGAGIREYRIFVDEPTGGLFAVLTLVEPDLRDVLPDEPVMQRWWAYMADIMDVDASNRPHEWPLEEMFYLP